MPLVNDPKFQELSLGARRQKVQDVLKEAFNIMLENVPRVARSKVRECVALVSNATWAKYSGQL